MKYIPTGTNFLFSVGVGSIIFFLQGSPPSANSSSAPLSFWPPRIVFSAMYRVQSGLLDTRSLLPVTEWLITRSYCSGLARGLLLTIIDRAITNRRSLTLVFFLWVVQPPFPAQSPWYLLSIGWLQHRHSQPRCGLVGRQLHCISISNNCFRQPEGITWHFRFSSVATD